MSSMGNSSTVNMFICGLVFFMICLPGPRQLVHVRVGLPV